MVCKDLGNLLYPKTPWDVIGCQNHLFGGPRGVTRGLVSIGGVGSLRVIPNPEFFRGFLGGFPY